MSLKQFIHLGLTHSYTYCKLHWQLWCSIIPERDIPAHSEVPGNWSTTDAHVLTHNMMSVSFPRFCSPELLSYITTFMHTSNLIVLLSVATASRTIHCMQFLSNTSTERDIWRHLGYYHYTLRLCYRRRTPGHRRDFCDFRMFVTICRCEANLITFDEALFDGQTKCSSVKLSDHMWGLLSVARAPNYHIAIVGNFGERKLSRVVRPHVGLTQMMQEHQITI